MKKSPPIFFLIFLVAILASCGRMEKQRDRFKTILDYVVYYGEGRVDDLARYDLAIVQPETLTKEEIKELKSKGTLSIAYLSVGEAEPGRSWYTDGRVNPRWLLGKNENWGSYFVDASQAGWQDLMVELTGEFIKKGYDGVFLDTVDTAEAFPDTKAGMVDLIRNLRKNYPNAILVQNRGFNLVDEVSQYLDGIMFEDLSTTYDFESGEYVIKEDTSGADQIQSLSKRNGLPILALDYAPPDNPGMANRAARIAREYGFIPAVSVINLDEIPDYQLGKEGPADLRVSSITAEGDEKKVNLVARVENIGLAVAKDVPLAMSINGEVVSAETRTFSPGDRIDWTFPWPSPVENSTVEMNIDFKDRFPGDNKIEWVFTYASIEMEPLLPYDQQQHRAESNGPQMTATFMVTPPTIDGDLSEWSALPCSDVNTREQVSFGSAGDWAGPQDLSGSICYGWNEENLFVGFEIADDKLVQQFQGGNLWMGDHVELWFDTQLQLDFESSEAGSDDFQLGISPGNFGEVPSDFVIFTPSADPNLYKAAIQAKIVRTAEGYAAELSIPREILKGLRLAEWQTIGATFEPSDTDTPGGSEQEMMMSSAPQSSSNWGDPTFWSNLVFSK